MRNWGFVAAVLMLLGCSVAHAQTSSTDFFRVTSPTGVVILTFDGHIEWRIEDETPPYAITCVVERLGSPLDALTSSWSRWASAVSTTGTMRVHAISFSVPPGMAFVPGGLFTMGDDIHDNLANNEKPVRDVETDSFFISRTPITKAEWDAVYQWATNNGYGFANAGSGKASNHPVHTITWMDAVKWCNARSEFEGRTPVYHAVFFGTVGVYRAGLWHVTNENVNWSANGYRLPTEAEWEKAARGGSIGRRYPWGNEIAHEVANYRSSVMMTNLGDTSHSGLPAKYHPAYESAPTPYTSPVASFIPNAYGLYDVVGNISELCWDRHATNYYSYGETVNPRGPNTGAPFATHRAVRGSNWNSQANECRFAYRHRVDPTLSGNWLGFRVVLPAE